MLQRELVEQNYQVFIQKHIFFLTVERTLQLEHYPEASYVSIQVLKIRNFYTWSDQAAKGQSESLFYILAKYFGVGCSVKVGRRRAGNEA